MEKNRKLTPQRERISLFRHGTVPFDLSPNAIVDAAISDIRTRGFNRSVHAMRRDKQTYPPGSDIRKQIPPVRKYAFLREHVAERSLASEIIIFAANHISDANSAQDVETLLVYKSQEKLQLAYEIAIQRELKAA